MAGKTQGCILPSPHEQHQVRVCTTTKKEWESPLYIPQRINGLSIEQDWLLNQKEKKDIKHLLMKQNTTYALAKRMKHNSHWASRSAANVPETDREKLELHHEYQHVINKIQTAKKIIQRKERNRRRTCKSNAPPTKKQLSKFLKLSKTKLLCGDALRQYNDNEVQQVISNRGWYPPVGGVKGSRDKSRAQEGQAARGPG